MSLPSRSAAPRDLISPTGIAARRGLDLPAIVEGEERIAQGVPVAAVSVQGQDVLVEPTEPRYTKTADGMHIAYIVMGNGPIDLVYAFGYQSNIVPFPPPSSCCGLVRRQQRERLVNRPHV
jgi:hypothetical protein